MDAKSHGRPMSAQDLAVLRDVISARDPALFDQIKECDQPESVSGLSSDVRAALVEVLADEFCATGLDSDDEPTQRGFMLEDLIDKVNPGTR